MDTPTYLPVSEVPTCPTELDIETMHLFGADSTLRGAFVAYAEWLRVINPPARSTPMGGPGQPEAPARDAPWECGDCGGNHGPWAPCEARA